jgi:hypothetical protein
MLPELLEQDHRQQAGPGPASGDHMEWCGRLGDGLAVAAGKLLAHVLDHLPGPRDCLQRLGDILAQLRQPRSAAAGAGRGRGDHDSLARQVLRQGLSRGPLAGEAGDRRGARRCGLLQQLVLAGGGLQLLELQLHLVEQPPLRSELGPKRSRFSFWISSLRWAISASPVVARASAALARASAPAKAASSVATCSARAWELLSMARMESQKRSLEAP